MRVAKDTYATGFAFDSGSVHHQMTDRPDLPLGLVTHFYDSAFRCATVWLTNCRPYTDVLPGKNAQADGPALQHSSPDHQSCSVG